MTTCGKWTYRIILALNWLCPTASGVAAYLLRTAIFIDKEKPSVLLSLFNSIVYDASGVLQIISGVILVRAIFSIKNFVKDRKAERFINTRMLVMHSYSFILYLVTTCIFYASFTLYAFDPSNSNIFLIFNICAIVWMCGSYVSEIILVIIFYDQGTKFDTTEEDKPDDFLLAVMHEMGVAQEDYDADI